MKIVINRCWGGFGLSAKATKRLAELEGRECYFFVQDYPSRKLTPISLEDADAEKKYWTTYDIPRPTVKSLYEHFISYGRIERNDPKLIQVVEELGEAASGSLSKLRIVEIPNGVDWEIDNYDGMESVKEVHQSWS